MQARTPSMIPPIDHLLEPDNDWDPTYDATPPGTQERRSHVPAGLKGLMLAVLEDGIRTYLTGKGRARLEAEAWVDSNKLRQPFDFSVICETLGLQPAAVREALQRMRERGKIKRRGILRTRVNARRSHRLQAPRKVSPRRARLAAG